MTDEQAADFALLLLRAGVGAVFVAHGFGKLHRRPGLEATTRWFDSIGLTPPRAHAVAAAVTELAAGGCLILGLATPLACAGLLALMTVAVVKATGRHGFGAERGGWEYNAVLVLIGLTLAVAGPGRWALDDALGLPTGGAGGLAVAVALGLAAACGLLGTVHLMTIRRQVP